MTWREIAKLKQQEINLVKVGSKVTDIKIIKKQLSKLLTDSINTDSKKIGVLFSGGIDSTIIAFLLKKLKIPFTCYTAALDEKGLKSAQDLIWAKKVAKQFNFKLKIKTIPLNQVEEYIKKIVPIIGDCSVVKVGVALPFYLACEIAKKDGCKTIFSGLGSEEIFAGYERHEKSKDINKECLKGLKLIYERDLIRDYSLMDYFGFELECPFLNKDLIEYALRIPSKLKIKDGVKKYILREIAIDLKIPKDISFRPKRAAQYGSNFDKAISKLSKRNKLKKSEYLRSLFNLGILYSSGKDSNYALYLMNQKGFKTSCLITLISENKDSYMFHTPAINLVKLQSESLEIPLIEFKTKGIKEKELVDLKKAIKIAIEKYQINGIVTGALYSTYQRNRIEKICKELKLTTFSPLWHMNQAEYMKELIKNKFKFIFTSIAAEGLDKSWLGKVIELEDVKKLIKLQKKIGLHPAGEGGEFETLVLNMPLFQKEIKIKSKKEMEDEITGRLVVEEVKFLNQT